MKTSSVLPSCTTLPVSTPRYAELTWMSSISRVSALNSTTISLSGPNTKPSSKSPAGSQNFPSAGLPSRSSAETGSPLIDHSGTPPIETSGMIGSSTISATCALASASSQKRARSVLSPSVVLSKPRRPGRV
jgi:hypothetical protein